MPVESCIETLATVEPVVVIFDQMDAMSLTISRDQSALDVLLGTVARLRHLANVRLLVSCRTFDLQQDPKLNSLRSDQTFAIEPLAEAQIQQVLQPWGIIPTEPLLALLPVPLHLKLYVDLLVSGVAASEQYRSLQQLYAALWRLHIEPGPPETAAAVYRLVEFMQSQRQISAPVALLDDLPNAARHLQQVGFIRREGERWQFAHQTLLDFCYARRFVAQGRSLSEEILASPQGLFERSQLVQVLAYLRGETSAAYRREVAALLAAETLRPHLRLLLIQWLAALPDPTTAEFGLIDGLLKQPDARLQFLQAAADNPAWFDHLRPHFLPIWLHSNDERLQHQLIYAYLHRIIRRRPNEVLRLLQSYLNQSATWNDRLAFCLNRLADWSNPQALSILQQLIAAGVDDRRVEGCLFHLAQVDPAVGCAVLRAYLDRRLQQVLAEGGEATVTVRLRLEDRLLGPRTLTARLLENAVEVTPTAVVTHLLPWFIEAALAFTHTQHDHTEYYPSDPIFAYGWEDSEPQLEGPAFARHLSQALGKVARSEPDQFWQWATRLSQTETMAAQRVLAYAYLAAPAEFAADIAAYLLADQRRWDLGEERSDTCQLLGAAFPYLAATQREQLAQVILDYRPGWEERGRRYGLTQLRWLIGIPVEFLPEPAYRRRQELERKFPDFELKPPPGVRVGWVGPPIEPDAVAKMSDAAWLQAIHKYGVERKVHPDFLKEGSQLLRLVAEQTQKEPARFYRAALQFDEAVPVDYFVAVINGLAETDNAPTDWLFDLVRHIASRLSGEVRRPICWALEKRAAAGVPDDLLELLTDWSLRDDSPSNLVSSPTPEGRPVGDNLHQFGINTNRGAALRAACRCALKRQPPQPESALTLLEQAAADPSPAVRSCVIYQLIPLLNEDEEQALAIFMRTVADQPVLLQTSLAHRFLYWTYYRHFPAICPLIEKLLHNDDLPTQQAGARLVCLAAMTYPEAAELEQQVMDGPAAWRRGAAEVYARNLATAAGHLPSHPG